jgi:hypothetical protein
MMEGIKHDANKPQIGFLLKSFPDALIAGANQNSFGATKYARYNWQLIDTERYENALMRHLLQYMEDPTSKDESGEYHLAAVIWNSLALYERNYGKSKHVSTATQPRE